MSGWSTSLSSPAPSRRGPHTALASTMGWRCRRCVRRPRSAGRPAWLSPSGRRDDARTPATEVRRGTSSHPRADHRPRDPRPRAGSAAHAGCRAIIGRIRVARVARRCCVFARSRARRRTAARCRPRVVRPWGAPALPAASVSPDHRGGASPRTRRRCHPAPADPGGGGIPPVCRSPGPPAIAALSPPRAETAVCGKDADDRGDAPHANRRIRQR